MPRSDFQQDWEEFDRLNPFVFEKLKEYALQVRRAGRDRFGIRQIWERLRWFLAVEVNDPNSDYRLNDHYTPFYARKLMAEVPELSGFFEIRDPQ